MNDRHRYDPSCPYCLPALLDPQTGETFGRDSPEMREMMKVWNTLPFSHREAFINVTVFNSRDDSDLRILKSISDKFEGAFRRLQKAVN
jgi:hypothetical protein